MGSGIILDWLSRLGLSMLLGSVLMGLSVTAGWILSRVRRSLPVRCVDWWLSRVVIPLLRTRRWSGRTLIIFTNNTLVLGLLVACGRWHSTGRIAVIAAGAALGIAMNRLSHRLAPDSYFSEPSDRRARRLVSVGVALNLLEIVAIILSLGLTIGTADLSIPAGDVWRIYLTLVTPLLLVAAAGESLWMGVTMASATSSDGTDDADHKDIADAFASEKDED